MTWRRVDGNGQLPVKATVRSFGRELVIADVDDGVAGTYECSAENDGLKSLEPVTARFQLAVECKRFLMSDL